MLFDQNLSHRLPSRLADFFPESAHVRPLGVDQATDSVIFEFAKKNQFAIVTQDSDFVDRSKLFGPPPKIVWLRCGNSTPKQIESPLRDNAAAILELSAAGSASYVELF